MALGHAELGVAEDLLHHPDVDALFEQERGGRVAGIVHPGLPDAGRGEDRAPIRPVALGGTAARPWARRTPDLSPARPPPPPCRRAAWPFGWGAGRALAFD